MFERLLVRPSEAAILLDVGRTKIYDLISSGEIPSVRLGTSIRIPLDQLKEYIAKQMKGGVANNNE